MKNCIEIIAEIAQGFEGNEELASLLTKGAIASNSDAIKFQLVFADELATPDYKYYKLFRELEMPVEAWMKISNQIHQEGRRLYFDIFGLLSLEVAKKVGADGVKLSTTEFYNNHLFDKSLESFDKLYLSVGGIEVDDIDEKLSKLNASEKKKVCLMYGFQSEPTPLEENNLNKLRILKERYPDFSIGFMDHSEGGIDDAYNISLIALGLGAEVIEKHITLDRELKLEDYISGVTPAEFLRFVNLVRRYEPVFGLKTLALSALEKDYKNNATKSVVATSNLKAGDILSQKLIALKRTSRPINENSILKIEDVIGQVLKIDVEIDTPIYRDYL